MYSNRKYSFKSIKEKQNTQYSTYTLKKLLERISDHEPGLVEIIKTFIFPRRNFNDISMLYYKINIYYYDAILIKLIYPVTKDNIDEKIDILESKLYQERYQYKTNEYILEMKEELDKNNKGNKSNIDYFKYLDPLINTIGLFYVMKYDYDIKQSRLYYISKYEESVKVMQTIFNKQYIKQHIKIDEIPFNTRLNNTRVELEAVQTKYNNYRNKIKQKMEHIFNNVI